MHVMLAPQNAPEAQSVSPTQLVAHVVAPAHLYSPHEVIAHAPWPSHWFVTAPSAHAIGHSLSGSVAAVTAEQVPSAAPVFAAEHASHMPSHALAQHTPSTQCPLVHEVSPLQVAPSVPPASGCLVETLPQPAATRNDKASHPRIRRW
jgi:hypothetical protein